MNSLSIVLGLLGKIWFLIPCIVLIVFFKTPQGKGILGEMMVSLMIKLSLDKKAYRPLRNITIPSGNATTQIDHIIVSKFGVFVLETKNMKGWIFGGEQQKQWTQQIFKTRTSFQNPLHQNYRHTASLIELIGIDPKKIFSIVVFTGASTFKTEMPENVTQGRQFIDYIKSFKEPILGEYDIIDILERIEKHRLAKGLKTHRAHVEQLRYHHGQGTDGAKRKSRKTHRSSFSRILLKFFLFTIPFLIILLLLLFMLQHFTNNFSNITLHSAQNQFSQKNSDTETKGPFFSVNQIKMAIEDILHGRIGDNEQENPQAPAPVEITYEYEIELFSGGTIYTDNLEIVGNYITYKGNNGLLISISRDEIRTLKRTRTTPR